LNSWDKVTQAVLNVAQTVALVVGAAWVYFKFIRGRTFARRAELGVTGDLMEIADQLVMKAVVELKNTGLSKLPLRTDLTWVELLATASSSWAAQTNLRWEKRMNTPVFVDHKWVESQETISDEVLMPVDTRGGDPWLAFRLHVEVWGKRPWYRDKGTKWVANTIVPAQNAKATDKAEGHPGVNEGGSRNAGEKPN
jgi:hypothetical protein